MRICRTLPLLFLLGACAPAATVPPAPAGAGEVAPGFVAELNGTAEAWNRGDLEGFIRLYLDSSTFVGSRGLVRGKEALREGYRRSYWKDAAAPESTLRFEAVELRPLGPEHALAVGRFVLTSRATGQQTAAGTFSLVLARTPQGWRILHDHSS